MRVEGYHPHILQLADADPPAVPLVAEYCVWVKHRSKRAKCKGVIASTWMYLALKALPVSAACGAGESDHVIADGYMAGVRFSCFRFFATNHANAMVHVRRRFLPGDPRPLGQVLNLVYMSSCVRYVPLDHPDVANGSLPVVGLAPFSATS